MKKGQIGMFETIATLLVFFILLVFGMIFYSYYTQQEFEEQKSRQEDLAAIALAQKISHFPELKCTKGDISIDNCFDLLKLGAFTDMMASGTYQDYYENLFGYSYIRAVEVYPNNQEKVIYSNTRSPGANPADINGTRTWVPLSLYDPKSKVYSMGYLEVVYIP